MLKYPISMPRTNDDDPTRVQHPPIQPTRPSQYATARNCSPRASGVVQATPSSAPSPPGLAAWDRPRRTPGRRLSPAAAAAAVGAAPPPRRCPGATPARPADTRSCAASSTLSLCPWSSSSRIPGALSVRLLPDGVHRLVLGWESTAHSRKVFFWLKEACERDAYRRCGISRIIAPELRE